MPGNRLGFARRRFDEYVCQSDKKEDDRPSGQAANLTLCTAIYYAGLYYVCTGRFRASVF